MTGVEGGAGQLDGKAGEHDEVVVLLVLRVQLEEVEPAEHHVGLLMDQRVDGLDDIGDALVGTAGDQHHPAHVGNQQVLLVDEGILGQCAVLGLDFQLTAGPKGVHLVLHIADEGQLIVDAGVALGVDEPVLKFTECRVQADIAEGEVLLLGVVGAEGVFVDVDFRLVVEAAERAQTAAVVVVAMGQHGDIHRFQVHAQLLGVADELVVGAHVEQNLVFGGLDIQAEAVSGGKVFPLCGIFQ